MKKNKLKLKFNKFGFIWNRIGLFNPGVTNVTVTISISYKFFLRKSIYAIVVLAHIFFNKRNRLDLRKIFFFSIVALDFALLKLSYQIVLGIG